MIITANEDVAAVTALREAFVAADKLGDADAMGHLLADNVVILHPQCGPITGKEAATAFMRDVLTGVHANFHKHVTHTTLALEVSGELAYEHGRLRQELIPRAVGPVEVETGEYLWTFAKASSGEWRIARISGAFTNHTPAAAVPPRRSHARLAYRRLGAELVVVFIGVFGAFMADNYRERLAETEQRRLLIEALSQSLLDAEVHGQEIDASMTRMLDDFAASQTAGDRPAPPVYRESGAERPPVKAWDAVISAGGARLIDPPLMFELALFYNRFESFGEKYQRYLAFSEARVLPRLHGPPAVFYEPDTAQLRGEYREFVNRLADIRDLDRALVGQARELRSKLSARLNN